MYHDASQYLVEPFKHPLGPLLDLILGPDGPRCRCMPGVRTVNTVLWQWQQRCFHYGRKDFHQALVDAGGASKPSSMAAPCQAAVDMGLAQDAAGCSEVGELALLQNTWTLWQRNEENEQFLERWLHWCLVPEVITNMPLSDQAVLELLVHQAGLASLFIPGPFAERFGQHPLVYLDANPLKHVNVALEEIAAHRQVVFVLPWVTTKLDFRRAAADNVWLSSLCLDDAAAVEEDGLLLWGVDFGTDVTVQRGWRELGSANPLSRQGVAGYSLGRIMVEGQTVDVQLEVLDTLVDVSEAGAAGSDWGVVIEGVSPPDNLVSAGLEHEQSRHPAMTSVLLQLQVKAGETRVAAVLHYQERRLLVEIELLVR
mmetsp:Transcript_68128/g.181285  ORF Transcript_68128/g.181285 Transcript_68128/m.181285 type:complete len:369 (+) Transcript_68128:355-1461(+)